MSTASMNKVLRQLHRTLRAHDAAAMSDGQLLERFLSGRDESALEALVRRHGPMVWGVCRRVLANHHDAEDAFQATFLVLMRKADSVRPRDMVANWLYGVAQQTARKARAMAAKRQSREQVKSTLPEGEAAAEKASSELQHYLDEELSRLPEKYRLVIVLCDLQGKTRKEAAGQMKCPEGTIAGRLARARAMLAHRLARRGLAVSGAALLATLAQQAAAGVPHAVLDGALHALAGAASAKAIALANGVVKAMLCARLGRLAAVFILAFALCGVGLFAYSGTDDFGGKDAGGEKSAAAVAALKKLEGTWIIAEHIEDGKKEALEQFRDVKHRLVIKDGQWTEINRNQIVFQCAIKLDAAATPMHLDKVIDGKWDFSINPRPNQYRWVLAIAKLSDDDKLVVCSAQSNEPRPTEFSAGQKSRRRLTTYHRQSKEAALPVPDRVLVKKDQELIQGVWKVLKVNHNGKMLPNEATVGDDQVWTIGDGKISVRYADGNTKEIAFRLHPAAKPKAVDVTIGEEGDGKTPYLGLYTLHGDTLQFAYNRNGAPGAQRPTDFFSLEFSESRGRRYFLLQRQPVKAGKAKDDPAKAILDRWNVVSFESVGDKAGWLGDPESVVFGRESTFGKLKLAPTLVIETKEGRVISMEYRVATTKTPHEIEFIPMALWGGPGKETFRGIFRIEGDRLRICMSAKSKDARPADFELAKGSHRFLMSLQRDQPEKKPAPPKGRTKEEADLLREQFKANADNFEITITRRGYGDPKIDLQTILLHSSNRRIEPSALGPSGKPIFKSAKITKDQALQIIETMDTWHSSAFFRRAAPTSQPLGHKEPYLLFELTHSPERGPRLQVAEYWGWHTLGQLGALRVEGDAGKLVNELIDAIQSRPAPKEIDKPNAKQPRDLNVLVIDGRVSKDRFDDAGGYLDLGLQLLAKLAPDAGPTIRPRAISAAQFTDHGAFDRKTLDCIFLCDVPRLSAREVERLEAFVKSGGGVVFCLGPQVDIKAYNEKLSRLLPLKLLEIAAAKSEHAFHLDIDEDAFKQTPLKVFAEEQDRQTLFAPTFQKFIRAEAPAADAKVRVIAYFAEKGNKSPRAGIAMCEHRPFAGEMESSGRVVLLTTTVNMDWNTWPASPSYLPMCHELLRFAADR